MTSSKGRSAVVIGVTFVAFVGLSSRSATLAYPTTPVIAKLGRYFLGEQITTVEKRERGGRRRRGRRRRRVTNRGRSLETNEIPFRSERSRRTTDGKRGESVRRKASRRRATLARMRTTLNERSLTSHAINLEEKRRFAKCGTAQRVPSRCIEGRVGPHSSRNPLPPLTSRVRRAFVQRSNTTSRLSERTKRGVKVDDFVEREKESRDSPRLSFSFQKSTIRTRLRVVHRE